MLYHTKYGGNQIEKCNLYKNWGKVTGDHILIKKTQNVLAAPIIGSIYSGFLWKACRRTHLAHMGTTT